VDRVAVPERVLVVVPVLKAKLSAHSPEDRLAEAIGLAQAIDLNVVDSRIVTVVEPRPSTLLGSGKVDELKQLVADLEAGLVIVDHTLSPGQQSNLEKAWQTKVIDRTGLILEIFGRRAQTREGRLQVELAHLVYQKGRLVRAWTHLERQRGGGGFMGGPGEAQLELDKRILDQRIEGIKRELADVVRTRELHRAGRRKVPYPIVAIVGYTNAGKSTLFNRVTGAKVLAMDQVFATLDPTMREVKLPSGRKIILSDTVGFISDLPTMLVAAFRATLEEVVNADLVLHVRDIAHAETDAQARDVASVLKDLGIDVEAADANVLEVWNKADLLDDEARSNTDRQARFSASPPELVSALNGEGLDHLLKSIDARFGRNDVVLTLTIPTSDGKLLHWLYQNADILERSQPDDGDVFQVRVRVPSDKRERLITQARAAGAVVTG
jgi:GTPase